MRKKPNNENKRLWICLVCFFLAAFLVMLPAITTQNYNLKVGDISPETILAPRDTVDAQATEELKQQARDAVSPIYLLDSTVITQAKNDNRTFFEGLKKAKGTAASYALNMGFITVKDYTNILTDSQVEALIGGLNIPITEETLFSALLVSDSVLDQLSAVADDLIESALKNGLKPDDASAAASAAVQTLESNNVIGNTGKSLIKASLTKCIRSNMVLDQAATDAAIKAAEDAVTAVEYKKGQAIVRQGDVLTERQILVLTGLGMMQGSWNLFPYISLALTLLLCMALYLFYGKNYEDDLIRFDRKDLIVVVIVLGTLLISSFLCDVEIRLLSAVLVSLTVSLTYNARTGIVIGILVATLITAMGYIGGVSAHEAMCYFIGNLFSVCISSISVQRFRLRSGTVLAAVLGGLCSAAVYLVAGLGSGMAFTTILFSMGLTVAGALICGVICLGTMPIWEALFGLVTPMKLMELCNPSSPLLKRLSLEAPGTYHHSVMVANLAEAAAAAVGGDSFIAWAGAYYHDVGKLSAPGYFSENQLGGYNPHNDLSPEESCAIIARHAHDGARILKEYGLPKVIVDMALSHHGDSMMLFFANKAKELYGPDVNMRKYCHTGRKPRTKEEAIVMLADGVEAATRSKGSDVEKTVNSIIKGKLSEGQLSLTPLTFQDLAEIADAFVGVLKGVYHTRVAYPEVQANELLKEGGRRSDRS